VNVARVILPWRVAGIAALVVLSGSGAAAEICMDVDLQFGDRRPSSAVVEAMKVEAAAIWRSYGVQIGWTGNTELDPCAAAQGSLDVLITHRPVRPVTSWSMPLGSTRVMPVVDHVPIHLDQDATERMIASLSRVELLRHLGRPMAGRADIGRALGRVLAHEIGHVILVAPYHQPRGLMRRSFLPAELIAHHRQSYTLSPEEVARLRRRERVLNARFSRRQSLEFP
jgi:hypothetical protein